jgi:ketosteroid isomerase-like protein
MEELVMSGGDEAEVRSVMSSYEVALNGSNTEAVMPLYSEDGVFMAPNNQSAVGRAVVRRAYDAVFKAITLKVKFCRTCRDVSAMGFCADQFRRKSDGQRHGSHKRGGEPGTLRLQERRRWQVADCSVQLFHYQSIVKGNCEKCLGGICRGFEAASLRRG